MSGSDPVELAFYVSEPDEKKNDEVIILIHGAMSSKESWRKIPGQLAQKTGMKVYAIDLRNHGDSPWSETFDILMTMNDIDNFMKEHNIPSAYFIGHSLGGIISMTIALSQPEKVKKLIVEDATLRPLGDEEKKMISVFANLMKKAVSQVPANVDLKTAQKAIGDFLESQTPKELLPPPERRDDSPIQIVKKEDGTYRWKYNTDVVDKFLLNMDTYKEHRDHISGKTYKNSTIFIYGTKSDINILKDKDQLLAAFPEAKFEGIEGASHLVHNEYPDEFSTLAIDFLQKS